MINAAVKNQKEHKMKRYFEYVGIPVVTDIDDLVEMAEELIAQKDLIKSMDF